MRRPCLKPDLRLQGTETKESGVHLSKDWNTEGRVWKVKFKMHLLDLKGEIRSEGTMAEPHYEARKSREDKALNSRGLQGLRPSVERELVSILSPVKGTAPALFLEGEV